MSEFSFIYILMVALALCIACIFIMRVRENNTVLDTEKPDFITEFCERKTRMLEINMPKLSFQTYLLLLICTPVVLTVVLWLFIKNKVFALSLAAFSVFLPDFVIRIIVDGRRKKYEERYVRALKLFAASIRSGLSIQQGVQGIINNEFISEDIREGFRQIDADIRVGISIEDAFSTFAEKTDNDDARDVASAITMQIAVGGAEARVIDTIARNIEERMQTKKRIRGAFAATDFMINAFDVMPFIALILVYFGMPEYTEQILEEPMMLLACIGILVFSIFGSFSIRKKTQRAKGGVK